MCGGGGGGSGDAKMLGKLSVPGVLLIWIMVGQWPTALSISVDGVCSDILSLSLGDGPI